LISDLQSTPPQQQRNVWCVGEVTFGIELAEHLWEKRRREMLLTALPKAKACLLRWGRNSLREIPSVSILLLILVFPFDKFWFDWLVGRLRETGRGWWIPPLHGSSLGLWMNLPRFERLRLGIYLGWRWMQLGLAGWLLGFVPWDSFSFTHVLARAFAIYVAFLRIRIALTWL